MSESDWELVTDCETAGVIDGKTELPVRSHPWIPLGSVIAINRLALSRSASGGEPLDGERQADDEGTADSAGQHGDTPG